MNVITKINPNHISKKLIKNMEKLQPILNIQVVKDSNVYCPKAEGTLQTSASDGNMNGKTVEWRTKYAHNLYYGVDYNFSKDVNPLARAKWFHEAKAKHKKDWIALLNKELK